MEETKNISANETEKEEKMPELTLEPEEREFKFDFKEPSFGGNDVAVVDETGVAAGAVDESELTEAEKQRVNEFYKQIDISNVKMVNSYGTGAQKGIATFSTTITSNVKTKEFGEVGDSLRELRTAIGSTMTPPKKGLAGLFQKGKAKVTIQPNGGLIIK